MSWTRFLRSAVATIALCAAPALSAVESLEVQVNRAIDRGVARVLAHQTDAGAFPVEGLKQYPGGTTALSLYALVKSGVDPDRVELKSALAAMEREPLELTYDVATRILALHALGDGRHSARIRELADWLVARFLADKRLWDYPGIHADLSNTQFAVLGLWAAERHGHKTSPEIWTALLEVVPAHQRRNGGFAYTTEAGHREAGGMTTAGITILELALPRAPASVRKSRIGAAARAALAKGWSYLDERFSGLEHPILTNASHHWFDEYYLYGIERVAALTDRREIAGRDWYREGALDLVAAQNENGGWGRLDATCFALLFLRRATFTTMERAVAPVAGEGVTPISAPARVRPRSNVPFIRRWLTLGPFDDADDLLLHKAIIPEERAAPRRRGTQGGRRWLEFRSPGNFVDLRDAAGSGDHQIVYAFTYLHATRDVETLLWVGHDDAARLWIDGELVHDFHYHEFPGHDSYAFPISMKAGSTHRVLFKVENWGGGHGLYARLADTDGRWPEGVLPSLAAADRELSANVLAHPELLDLPTLLEHLPTARRREQTFNDARSIGTVAMTKQYGHYPYWVGESNRLKDRSVPRPGGFGCLGLHPNGEGDGMSARAFRKVRVPDAGGVLRVRAAGCAHAGERADAIVRTGIFDGELHWLAEGLVGAPKTPGADGWQVFESDISEYAGRDVLLIVEAATGGLEGWYYEGVFLDEMSLVPVPK